MVCGRLSWHFWFVYSSIFLVCSLIHHAIERETIYDARMQSVHWVLCVSIWQYTYFKNNIIRNDIYILKKNIKILKI